MADHQEMDAVERLAALRDIVALAADLGVALNLNEADTAALAAPPVGHAENLVPPDDTFHNRPNGYEGPWSPLQHFEAHIQK